MILEKVAQMVDFFKPATIQPMSLEQLFHKGDMNALESVMREHQKGIFGLGLRLLCDRDKAADFCQDVFIKAYEKCGSYDPARPLKPWLFQVAANLGRDLLRRKQEISIDDETMQETPEAANRHQADEIAMKNEIKSKVWKVVNQLNVTYREVIALRFSSDLSMQEIADSLGISLAAAKVRLCRGLRAFEDAFKAQGGEEYVM
jgi:RNA polymerase sigma-70 factor, ECF subfamily